MARRLTRASRPSTRGVGDRTATEITGELLAVAADAARGVDERVETLADSTQEDVMTIVRIARRTLSALHDSDVVTAATLLANLSHLARAASSSLAEALHRRAGAAAVLSAVGGVAARRAPKRR